MIEVKIVEKHAVYSLLTINILEEKKISLYVKSALFIFYYYSSLSREV